MLYFATLFNLNYLNKGLALHESLERHIRGFKLYVLCLDNETYDYFKQSGRDTIHPIQLHELEQGDVELAKAKANRSKVEYYFTLSPVLPLYILEKFSEVDFITTLDADIFFYGDPKPIYDEFEGKSVLITPHRFTPKLKGMEVFGLYNVSYQIFRRDTAGLACLHWWRARCIEWCYDKHEKDRFADQKYLDEFESRFQGVVVLRHEGAGLAPWNFENYGIMSRRGVVYSNSVPLIFYHFHGLRPAGSHWFIAGIDTYASDMPVDVRNFIYHPYLSALSTLSRRTGVRNVNSSSRPGHEKGSSVLRVLKSHVTLYYIGLYTIGINAKGFLNFASRFRNWFKRK